MIDGIDYFPKRDKNKKGLDREWNELKKIKISQETGKDTTKESDQKKKDKEPSK